MVEKKGPQFCLSACPLYKLKIVLFFFFHTQLASESLLYSFIDASPKDQAVSALHIFLYSLSQKGIGQSSGKETVYFPFKMMWSLVEHARYFEYASLQFKCSPSLF